MLHCLPDYSSTAAAEAMGQDQSKISYLVCSAPPPAQLRTAARRAAAQLAVAFGCGSASADCGAVVAV